MAWPQYRVSSRVLKRLAVGDGSGIGGGIRRVNQDGRLKGNGNWLGARSVVKGANFGAEGFVVPQSKRSGEAKDDVFNSRSEGKVRLGGLKSSRIAASWNYDHGRHGFLHTSSLAGAPEPTVARSSSISSTHVQTLETVHAPTGVEEDVLQLENGALLYSGKKTKELLTTLFNLQLLSFEPMVDLSMKVLTSPLMKSRILSAPIFWTVKKTAYSHFCAGEDAAEAAVTLNRMWELGLKGILDYSLEDADDNKSCDHNCAGFLSTIYHTRSLPEGSVSFACVKISAICPISLLERVSDLLRWQHKNPKFKLPWKQDGMPILAADSPTYHTQKAPEPLSPEEEKDLLRGEERLSQLCEACVARNLPTLVDAEYSSIQPAIDYMTYGAVFTFNKAGTPPFVYNTLQTYLKDAPSRLALALVETSRRNASLALKIVRGAYITREKALAASIQAPSPIHNSIQDTHSCYNSCVSIMLDRIASKDSAALMIATHNSDSGKFAAKKVMQMGFDKKDPRVHFAQLKGMSDSLSLALARGGFSVSKYLPFGPVAHVIPYLVRRAEENRGVFGSTMADRRRIRAELVRRLAFASGVKEGSTVNSS